MKNVKMVIGLVIGVFVIGIAMGIGIHKTVVKNTVANNNVEVKRVLTESTNEIKLSEGDIYREFSNDAWVIENYKNNTYELCIPELGDWTYVLHNKSDFDKLVKTYLINVNENLKK